MSAPQDPNALVFYRAAKQRSEDAHLLMRFLRTTGAMYLGGYTAECIFKALILASIPARTRKVILSYFRGRRGHDFEWLRRLYLQHSRMSLPKDVLRHLVRISSWSTDLRYSPSVVRQADAQLFLHSVTTFTNWADGRM